jgi:hypothetical protein
MEASVLKLREAVQPNVKAAQCESGSGPPQSKTQAFAGTGQELRQLLECVSLLALWKRASKEIGRKISACPCRWRRKRQRTAAVQNASVRQDRLECARAFGVRQSSGALETGIEGNGRKILNLPLLVEVKAAEDCRSPKRKRSPGPAGMCASFWSAPVFWRFGNGHRRKWPDNLKPALAGGGESGRGLPQPKTQAFSMCREIKKPLPVCRKGLESSNLN